ncbi:MAG: hypothetical protein JWL77_6840 [Chthonomonadaceae bacterium]|nr:hypothetical protein [Chthonomonadaceae bacterium]
MRRISLDYLATTSFSAEWMQSEVAGCHTTQEPHGPLPLWPVVHQAKDTAWNALLLLALGRRRSDRAQAEPFAESCLNQLVT